MSPIPLAILVLIAASVLAFGGVYSWVGVPLMAGCGLLAVICRPRILASADCRLLDLALGLFLLCVVLQLMPLPEAMLARLTPQASSFYSAFVLDYSIRAADGPLGPQAMSLDLSRSLSGLTLVSAVIFLFWTCRSVIGAPGARGIVRWIAWTGLAVALLAIVQRATSRHLIYGFWQPIDPGAEPFGPFVNRNHFVTWMLMAVPLTVGYIIARVGSQDRAPGLRDRLALAFSSLDLRTVWLVTAGCVMTLSMVLANSRSGLLSFAIATAMGAWLSRHRLRRHGSLWLLGYTIVMILVVAMWADPKTLLEKLDRTLSPEMEARWTIWRQTMPIIGDFWLTGTGLGTYQTAMLVYQQSDRLTSFNHAHNHFLQLAAEGGLLLSIPVAIGLIAFVRLVYQRLTVDRSAMYWIRVGAVTGLTAVVLQSLWETGLRIPANAILCAVVAALAVHELPGGNQPSG